MVEKFLEQSHLQKPEEEDKPVKDTFYVEGGMGKRADMAKRLANTKLGDKLQFSGGVGIVVAKSGEYLTLNVDGQNKPVHVNETYAEGDIISQVWTQMMTEGRQSLLRKAKLPVKFATRNWFDLPEGAKIALKSGFAGREEGITREQESESYQDKINPKHVNTPVKEKSDVEYGAYGGITTRTFFDAKDEYEDDGVRAKKPLSGPSGKVEVNDPVTGARYKDGEGGDGGVSITTDTTGANNPVYGGKREQKKKGAPEQNPIKFGMRYGVTKEDLEKFQKTGTLR